jgi:hypothetical protein
LMLVETVGQYCRRLSVNQAKIRLAPLQRSLKIHRCPQREFFGSGDVDFISPDCLFLITAAKSRRDPGGRSPRGREPQRLTGSPLSIAGCPTRCAAG